MSADQSGDQLSDTLHETRDQFQEQHMQEGVPIDVAQTTGQPSDDDDAVDERYRVEERISPERQKA